MAHGWTQEDVDRLNAQRQAPQYFHNLQVQSAQLTKPPTSKYRSRRTQVDGIWFDSAREAKRYQELKLLEHAGAIRDLELQPAFELLAFDVAGQSGKRVTVYHADFRYFDLANGEIVVEDVKSKATKQDRAWSVRKRWAEACHGIQIQEIG